MQKPIAQKAALAFVIGRFQPLHSGHEFLIDQALELAERVVVLVGSSGGPRTPKNPFTFEEREHMIKAAFGFRGRDVLFCEPLYDFAYNETAWIEQVQQVINYYRDAQGGSTQVPSNKCIIVGHEKDASSYYLKVFPQYKFVDVGYHSMFNSKCMDATRVRELIFENELVFLTGVLSGPVFHQIGEFVKSPVYKDMVEEYEHIKAYHASWAKSPYTPFHQTADAVVVQSGHILLGQRKKSPGRGLWALPGGFVNKNERIFDAAVRELYEETTIKIQERLLRRCLVDSQMFDDPNRSLRGRVITNAFMFKLDDTQPLPQIKAADDLEQVRWVPFDEVRNMRAELFEDHYEIIDAMLAKLANVPN